MPSCHSDGGCVLPKRIVRYGRNPLREALVHSQGIPPIAFVNGFRILPRSARQVCSLGHAFVYVLARRMFLQFPRVKGIALWLGMLDPP